MESMGVMVSRKRVARLIREAGLVGCVSQVTRKQPGLKRFKAAGENLLLDMAGADDINQVWVADVTYIKVKNKLHYLATVAMVLCVNVSPERVFRCCCMKQVRLSAMMSCRFVPGCKAS